MSAEQLRLVHKTGPSRLASKSTLLHVKSPLPPVQVVADAVIDSVALNRALLETYLGSSSVLPDARAAWVGGAKALLESENVRRSSRKSGGG